MAENGTALTAISPDKLGMSLRRRSHSSKNHFHAAPATPRMPRWQASFSARDGARSQPCSCRMASSGGEARRANGGVALMLYRFRSGDANMRSVWICSRNDALGKAAVKLAAMGVFGTGFGRPDVGVAAIMGGLGLWGGWQIVHQARGELRKERALQIAIARCSVWAHSISMHTPA